MDCSPPGSSVHGFSRQEYWSGLPFPPPGDLPYPEIKLTFPESPALADGFFTTSATWEAPTLDGSLLDSAVHGFSRQEYWSGLLFPSPGDLPNPGIEPGPLALQTDALPSGPLHEYN